MEFRENKNENDVEPDKSDEIQLQPGRQHPELPSVRFADPAVERRRGADNNEQEAESARTIQTNIGSERSQEIAGQVQKDVQVSKSADAQNFQKTLHRLIMHAEPNNNG